MRPPAAGRAGSRQISPTDSRSLAGNLAGRRRNTCRGAEPPEGRTRPPHPSQPANPGGMLAAKAGLRAGTVTKVAFSLAMAALGDGLQHMFSDLWPALCERVGATLATTVMCGFIPASFYWGNSLLIGWRTGWNDQSSPRKLQPVSPPCASCCGPAAPQRGTPPLGAACAPPARKCDRCLCARAPASHRRERGQPGKTTSTAPRSFFSTRSSSARG